MLMDGCLNRSQNIWVPRGRPFIPRSGADLEDKPHTRKRRALKTDLRAMNAVKRLQENPELGAYRIHFMIWRARTLFSLLMARLLAVRGFDAIQMSLRLEAVCKGAKPTRILRD